ncbi:DUF7691 family protein [Streptomyces pseudogriseolus]
MSRVISCNTAGKAAVLSYLGAGGKLMPEQHRVLFPGRGARRAGVDEDLLLYPHVFSGPPKEMPFLLPHAVDGPHIGMFPLAKARPAADVYRAVSGSVSPEFRDELDRFASLLESEHGEWEYATKALDWYDQDTIFFSITG